MPTGEVDVADPEGKETAPSGRGGLAQMSEAAQRFWDVVIKAITAVVAIGVALTGLSQYREVARNDVANQKIERYKLVIERYNLLVADSREQVKTLRETTEVVTELASTSDAAARSKAVKRFWQLYWSDLIGVEDRNVEASMVGLGDALRGGSGSSSLGQRSHNVVVACFNQIHRITDGVKPPSLDELEAISRP